MRDLNYRESILEIDESQATSKYSAPIDNEQQFLQMDVEESPGKIKVNVQEKNAKSRVLNTFESVSPTNYPN